MYRQFCKHQYQVPELTVVEAIWTLHDSLYFCNAQVDVEACDIVATIMEAFDEILS